MGIKKVKAIELVFDWELYPRCKIDSLDSSHIASMKEALRAGVTLPPVVANSKDNRLTDGFHRTRSHLSVFGDDAEIMVDFRDYKNDAEMFEDSVRLNANHGLHFSPKDRAHIGVKSKRFKIPAAVMAGILNMDKDRFKQFLDSRTAMTKEGELIPLSGGMKQFKGKTLTRKQENYARGKSAPLMPTHYINMLINQIKANCVIYDDKAIESLKQLVELIIPIIEGAVHE